MVKDRNVAVTHRKYQEVLSDNSKGIKHRSDRSITFSSGKTGYSRTMTSTLEQCRDKPLKFE